MPLSARQDRDLTTLDLSALDTEQIRQLSDELARRNRALERADLPHGIEGLTRTLEQDLARVRRRLSDPDDADLHELARIQHGFLSRDGARLLQRAADGRSREGSGTPLRLRDLQRIDGPGRAGVIEIRRPEAAGEASRKARDVCLDVASLALDLTRGGRSGLAERLLSSFASTTNDFELYGVVDYYERQCAIARAAGCATPSEARSWILVGLSTRRPPLLPPMLVAVGGLVASGKSTIARLAAEHMAAPRLEADRARQHLTREDGARSLARGFDDVVYAELIRWSEIVLSSGRPVVLDACFPQRSQRDVARRLASECGWPFLFIECRVDPETARKRLVLRGGRSGAAGWTKIYEAVARRWETAADLPAEQRLTLDCARPVRESEALVLERIAAAPIGHELP